MNDNDKIESLLGEIESSLKIIIFIILFLALGSCYQINSICDDVQEYIETKNEVQK